LLVRDIAKEFGPRVRVSVEEYGDSPTAKKFGVRRYPVVFVDDVLFARPKDFGFGGTEDVSGGLYLPWLEPDNQKRFKDDLRRTVSRRLTGETVTGLDVADVTSEADAAEAPAELPSLDLTDVRGSVISPTSVKGRPVVVEMWATWCPPCRSTMTWLNTLQKKYGDRATVIAIAVDSMQDDVDKVVAAVKPNYRIVMGTPEVIKAFGAVAAVPKLVIYDGDGKRAKVIYGAPPDLHKQIEAALEKVVGPRTSGLGRR
jgi:thiol-disulfide isomerase/thioredoxin